MKYVVEVTNLRKRYGSVVALAGLNLHVPEGTIFCIVGPNGAGKTTAIESILGLRSPDSGEVSVLGLDPIADRFEVTERVGAQLQEGNLPARMRVKEALELFSAFYEEPLRSVDLFKAFDLEGFASRYVSQLSGGQRRRLHVALAFVGNPDLVFLDEPTTGMDPQARAAFWDYVRSFATSEGRTAVVTTHYMQEAQDFANLVCVIDQGVVVASGSTTQLLSKYGLRTRISIRTEQPAEVDGLADLPEVTHAEVVNDRLVVFGNDEQLLQAVLDSPSIKDRTVTSVEANPASLEDLYLHLTGREYRGEGS